MMNILRQPADRATLNANLTVQDYQTMYSSSVENPEEFWDQQARQLISWEKEWDSVLEWNYTTPSIKWFTNAKLNVCFNCVDRHIKDRGSKIAIKWEGNEPGETNEFTYNQLLNEVCRFANVLKKYGVRKGDRVALYMPMIPQTVFAMLACARIGAIHSVIFAGFSADAVRDRVLDSECKVLITANEGVRGSKKIPLKNIVDEALESVSCIEKVFVWKRTEASVQMKRERDLWLHDELPTVENSCPCEVMDSEDPLFILYTSGSTGKPKGVLHTQGGYLLFASITHKYVFDLKEDDVYFCAADVGWITGHSYVVYGPLANGATTLMFESIPNYPDAGRYWDVIARHRVNIFYTAPTAIRAVAKEGEKLPAKYDLSSLRVIGSVGEPINEDAWLWYYENVGRNNCALVDTWWQTETGGILISPIPGVTSLKPGSATFPFFGIQPVIVDEKGSELKGNGVRGRLCMKYPWPGQMRTVYGDHKRFFDTYFSQFPGLYFTGDASIRDEDGFYWITGRVDDVINVAGHRIGTAEVESAIVHSGVVAEAAVVAIPHEIKGSAIYAFCILRESSNGENLEGQIKDAVRKGIGGFAVPEHIQIVPGLPKTRSGKIMRRILRQIACGEVDSIGDITTLADPTVVETIIQSLSK